MADVRWLADGGDNADTEWKELKGSTTWQGWRSWPDGRKRRFRAMNKFNEIRSLP